MRSYETRQIVGIKAVKVYTPILMLAMVVFSSRIIAQQKPFFVDYQNNPLKNYTVPSNGESHPFFVDIDGDGDLDCFSGEFTNGQVSKIYFFQNDGTARNPVFKLINGQNNPLGQVEANRLSIPYFIDIDGDGDYDCFIGEGNTGAIMYYKNVGTATRPNFQKQSAAFNPLSMVKFSTSNVANPAFADIDGDGDYDCLVVDEAGFLNYFKNTGTVKEPAFVHLDNNESPFRALTTQGSIYNVAFEDWNKDGLVDLFINTSYYKNIGTKLRPQFNKANNTDNPILQNISSYKFTYTPLRWVDLNNDGKEEVVQGNANGGFTYQTLSDAHNVAPVNSTVSIHVSPNPSSNEFVLHISPVAPSVIRVIDVQGKLLATQITSSSTIKFGTELKTGAYILQVMQNNRVIYNQKIIKE
jgi:hypothetical protein